MRAPTRIPLLVIRGAISEEQIAADMARGARDTLTLENLTRAHSVIARELKSYRIERALRDTMHSAHEYRSQLETVMTRSHDAIAQVQEGILVDANQSWLDLIGAPDAQTVVGQPVMDFFEDGTHVALKGALVACQQGRWSDHSLNARLLITDGSMLELELVLTQGQHDGEPSVRLMVPTQQRKTEDIATDLADAVKRNPRSGLLYRVPLLDSIHKRLAQPVQAGSRFLVFIRPDHFARVEQAVGVVRSEDVLVALSALVRAQLAPADLLGHFGGASLMALIERGNSRDAELWAERLRALQPPRTDHRRPAPEDHGVHGTGRGALHRGQAGGHHRRGARGGSQGPRPRRRPAVLDRAHRRRRARAGL